VKIGLPRLWWNMKKQLVSDAMEGLAVGLARASQNPEILKLQKQQQTQLPQSTKK